MSISKNSLRITRDELANAIWAKVVLKNSIGTIVGSDVSDQVFTIQP